mmetsp:Transcript_22350/g.55329  ORF Transcript_22350/g.55329 Transcript_22350/m.55329 type:complete len:275 (-) Transcript_22350:449-1273(-)
MRGLAGGPPTEMSSEAERWSTSSRMGLPVVLVRKSTSTASGWSREEMATRWIFVGILSMYSAKVPRRAREPSVASRGVESFIAYASSRRFIRLHDRKLRNCPPHFESWGIPAAFVMHIAIFISFSLAREMPFLGLAARSSGSLMHACAFTGSKRSRPHCASHSLATAPQCLVKNVLGIYHIVLGVSMQLLSPSSAILLAASIDPGTPFTRYIAVPRFPQLNFWCGSSPRHIRATKNTSRPLFPPTTRPMHVSAAPNANWSFIASNSASLARSHE